MARTYFSEFFPLRTVQGERGTTSFRSGSKVGPWEAGIAYNVGDLFTWEGSTYAVTVAHTSTGLLPDLDNTLLLSEGTGIGGQTLVDNTFSETWWTLQANSTRTIWPEARAGYAALYSFTPGVARLFNKGPLSKMTQAYPGQSLFFRLTADPSGGLGYSNVVSGTDRVVDSQGNYVVSGVPSSPADFDIFATIEWLDEAGNFVAVTPGSYTAILQSKGKHFVVGTSRAPDNPAIMYGRLLITHNATLTGKTGTWAIYDPWLAEYQPTADNTSEEVPVLVPIPTVKLYASHTGALTTPLPVVFKATRNKGNADVSASTTWSIEPSSLITASINNTVDTSARGTVTITAASSSGKVKIISYRDGVTLSQEVLIDVIKATAPTTTNTGGSTGGGTTTYPTTPATYSTPISDTVITSTTMVQVGQTLTFVAAGSTAGAVVTAQFSAPLDYTIEYALSDAAVEMEAKWQVSSNGGTTWNDVGPFVDSPQFSTRTYVPDEPVYDDTFDENPNVVLQTKMGSSDSGYSYTEDGYISITQTTACYVGDTYSARLMVRKGTATGVSTNFTPRGTASVTV